MRTLNAWKEGIVVLVNGRGLRALAVSGFATRASLASKQRTMST